MDDVKLLPCPFCGESRLNAGYNEYGGLCTTCDNCNAMGPPSEADVSEVMAAWNRRTPAPDGRAEGLREAAVIVAKSCQKCGGEGWLWGHELSDPPDVIGHDDTRYSCDGDLHKCADATLARAAELEKADE